MLALGTWHLLHHPLHRHVQEGGPPHGQLRRAAPGGAHQGLRHRHRGRRGLLQGLQPNHGQLISNPYRVLLLSSRRHKQMRLTLTDELPVVSVGAGNLRCGYPAEITSHQQPYLI